jgi:hypothetical protein
MPMRKGKVKPAKVSSPTSETGTNRLAKLHHDENLEVHVRHGLAKRDIFRAAKARFVVLPHFAGPIKEASGRMRRPCAGSDTESALGIARENSRETRRKVLRTFLIPSIYHPSGWFRGVKW